MYVLIQWCIIDILEHFEARCDLYSSDVKRNMLSATGL